MYVRMVVMVELDEVGYTLEYGLDPEREYAVKEDLAELVKQHLEDNFRSDVAVTADR